MSDSPRTILQNRLLWSLLTDIANQLEWCVDGRMQKITKEDYKEILTAGLRKEQRIAQGIDGGFVLLGQRTSKMTKQQFVELIDFIHWFMAEKNIKMTAPQIYETWANEYREK